MHDAVVSLLAFCFGQVYFLPKKLMLWRQHASNVMGIYSISAHIQNEFSIIIYMC